MASAELDAIVERAPVSDDGIRGEGSFETVLPTVIRAVNSVLGGRRNRKDFADDFRSWVMVKILERERAILSQFRGESTLFTYLRVVVERLYCDYSISQTGKWRPSRKAKQLGIQAMDLERLVYRDGYTLGEAISVLQCRYGKSVESELRDAFLQLPCRDRRSTVGSEAVLEQLPDKRPSPYETLRREEIDRTSRAVRGALAHSLAELADEDREILELRFFEGLRIPQISQRLDLKQRSVYNRIYRILRSVRTKLEARGVRPGTVREMMGERAPLSV
jgi:RNA polymerase sigma factor for flagellar operon FliA